MDGSSQREDAERQDARTGGQGICRRASVRSGEDGRHAGDQHWLHESRRGPSEKAWDSYTPGRPLRFFSLAISVLALPTHPFVHRRCLRQSDPDRVLSSWMVAVSRVFLSLKVSGIAIT